MKEEILARKKKCDAKLKEKSILKMHNTKNERLKRQVLRTNPRNKISYFCSMAMNLHTFEMYANILYFIVSWISLFISLCPLIAPLLFSIILYFMAKLLPSQLLQRQCGHKCLWQRCLKEKYLEPAVILVDVVPGTLCCVNTMTPKRHATLTHEVPSLN